MSVLMGNGKFLSDIRHTASFNKFTGISPETQETRTSLYVYLGLRKGCGHSEEMTNFEELANKVISAPTEFLVSRCPLFLIS